MRHRILTASVKNADGSSSERRHQSTDDPAAIAREICSIADECPGEAIAFTLTTEYESETPPATYRRPAASSSSSETAPPVAIAESGAATPSTAS